MIHNEDELIKKKMENLSITDNNKQEETHYQQGTRSSCNSMMPPWYSKRENLKKVRLLLFGHEKTCEVRTLWNYTDE